MNNRPDNKKTYMAKLDIIQQGDTGKYQLIIDRDGFDPQTCDFTLRLSWGYRGESLEIRKEEMFHDEDWNVFFMFDSSPMFGMVVVTCEYWVADSDVGYPEQGDAVTEQWFRVNVDRQQLCLVTDSSTARICKGTRKYSRNPDSCVQYDRIMQSDANSLYAILRAEKEVVRSSDNKIIRVRKNQLT